MAMYNYTPNTNYYGADEEEERRRREQEQLAADDAARLAKIQTPAPPMVEQAGVPVAGAVAPEPEPIKQTITYDPVSGEQRMKIEGNARDLSAENPLTPTLTMPGAVSPEQMAQQQAAAEQQQREAQQAQQQQVVEQQQPVIPPEQAQPAAAPEMPQLPQPGASVQVAGPAQMPTAPAQPYTGPGQGEEAQTVGQAQFAPQQPQQPEQPPATDPMAMFTAAVGDTNRLLQIYNDKSIDPALRRMAGREASRQLKAETEQVEAENKVKTMTPNEVQRELRKSDEEGSWTKRVIFGLLNMQGAMAAEDAKLGIGAKFQSTNLNGQPVEIKVRADGKAMEGYNAQTLEPLSKKELVAATAQMAVLKGAQAATGTRVRDSKGTEWSQVPTTQGMKFYNNKGEAGVPEGRTVPISPGTDLELEQAKADIKTIAQFSGQTAQARLNAFENTNKLRADRNLPLKTLEEMGLNPDGSLIGEAVRRPGTTTQAAPVQAAPAAAAQAAPVQAAPAAATQRTPPVRAQAAPGGGVRLSVVPGGAVAPSTGGKIPTAAEMAEATKETDLNRTIREAAAKAQINVGQNLEEQKNKVRTAMPASEGNVIRILTTLNDIVTHPGLDKTVGLPRILATPLEMIPGGDQRAFAQKFKQLGGQEFLAAYNELRGGGGISETEGAKAEQAISALKDTGISPEEFKKNMWILQDAVKSGFDRQRELVGQTPKYRESPDREAAKEWLRNNPNSPKAAAIRKKLSGY